MHNDYFLSKNKLLPLSPAILLHNPHRLSCAEVLVTSFEFQAREVSDLMENLKAWFLFPFFLIQKVTRDIERYRVVCTIFESLSFGSAVAQNTMHFGGHLRKKLVYVQ